VSPKTVFSKSVLKTKKNNKIKLLFCILGRIIKNNTKLFFFCSLLAVITAVINFNIGVNMRNALFSKEKTLNAETIKEIKEEGGKEQKYIEITKIKAILDNSNKKKNKEQEITKSKITNAIEEIKDKKTLTKKEAEEIIKEAGISERKV
jgi:hypothetical protein